MSFTLRGYQNAFINSIRQSLGLNKRIIACAATGSGKSKVFITIAKMALNKGKTVLIISESTKIYAQLIREVSAVEIKAGCRLNSIVPNTVYLAMAQTLIRRKNLIEQFWAIRDNLLIITDEAHIATSNGVVESLPHALAIGFTATPYAKDAKHLPRIYKDCVVGPQPHDLVLDGFLSPYKHFERRRADLASLQQSGGEFTEESQEEIFEQKIVYDGLMDDLRTVNFRKCIIFTASIKHCEHVTAQLKAREFNCVQVHSKLSKEEEKYNMFNFTQGLVPICVSVGVLTKGFDYPPIDLVVLNRATNSLSLYLQMIGRASRVLEEDIGKPVHERLKKYFTVLDYGGNFSRHLPWDFEREWAELWKDVKPKKLGVAPFKTCPACDYGMPASTSKCPNCGYIFTAADKPKEEQPETVLVEVTSDYNKFCVGKNISALNPKELAIYAKSKNKKSFAIRVAKHHALRDESFIFEFAKAMQYKTSWCRRILKEIEGESIEFKDVVLK